MAQPQHTSRISRKWMIRATGSALLLILLFWLLPWDAVIAGFRSTPPAVFVSVFAIFLLAHVGAALKWRLLLGHDMPVVAAIRAHFAGLAANLCLPGAIGGDAVRAGLAQSSLQDGPRVVAVALVDRVIDMLALLTLSVIGIILTRDAGTEFSVILQSLALLALAVAGFLALPHLLPKLWTLIPSLPGRGFADRLSSSFRLLAGRPALLVSVFLASTAVQLVLVSIAWWLAVAAGAGVAFGPWLFAWPLAKLVAVLPVSLNGLGLREATLAGFLLPFGAHAPAVVAAGLMWQAVLFAAGGFGALVLVMTGKGLPFAGKKDVVRGE
ncbi:lysylphosphatidylglycerol synthase transmembrane domain-containing protein [Ruegeria sp.]|uniref:lysylphosphatidylglycerol synthase transmembrane domain-containing protein n=1 Tax=Ruegeria sp. TaxID=1879320 RepID=UPI002326B42A|nr:lysylphosphatidylglycerol synthase transmembrane domain-containing protein [Ruegeria sp.]MDA7964152.1 flippase-like domain-containing protein [Ruegeria sp.]